VGWGVLGGRVGWWEGAFAKLAGAASSHRNKVKSKG
jgi:hypothetical protein